MVGGVNTRLVILRGNSASGKSTIARRLRERVGRGIAWVEQDYLRRVVVGEHDRPDLPNIGLIDTVVRYSLDSGYHVIAEGIFGAARYGRMLRKLADEHAGVTRSYYFDIPLDETLRRHRTKPRITVGPEQLRQWYQPRDLLDLPTESIIGAAESEEQIVERLVCEAGLGNSPALDRLGPAALIDYGD